ncbi:MAG TPA: M20/M25/M40 family metallo-hydrolase [Patescibacteria group bacterium]|nr:M20/M25/M40 family metallo-hydrolase [Patescibacteria group bacterium]
MSTQEELLQTTKELIAFQTTEDRPGQLQICADYIENFFSGTGLTVQRFEHEGIPSVVVTKGTKTPMVFLSGHFDVVPGDPEQFVPSIEGEKLFGRGAMDMKSGDAAMMHLMRDLATTDHSIGLMLTGDEEVGGFNGTEKLLKAGYVSKVAIIPDGGEAAHQVMKGQKGIFRVTLTAHGVNAHGSTPWLGENAINRLVRILPLIEAQFLDLAEHPADHWVTTLNVGRIQGGVATNQVPDIATAHLDIRFPQSDSPEQIEAHIRAILPGGVEAAFSLLGPPVDVSMNHPLARPFLDAIRTCGREPQWGVDHGGSDGRFFAEHGTLVLISQPDGGNLHAPGEWVHIPSIKFYYDVLKSYVNSVARG